MGSEKLQTGKEIATIDKRQDIEYVNETFKLGETVEHLHYMMKGVTKEEVTSKTVNAACNCVQQLNQTIDMAIKAAKFLREQ